MRLRRISGSESEGLCKESESEREAESKGEFLCEISESKREFLYVSGRRLCGGFSYIGTLVFKLYGFTLDSESSMP